MKIAVVAAICVRHDAISAAAADQAAIAATLAGVERVDLFAEWIDRPLAVDGHVVAGPSALLHHPRFRDADVVIVHWGIHCPTLDALTVAARAGPPSAVMFHNMTPVELVAPDRRGHMERSRRQLAHLTSLDLRWWTFSEENRRQLTRHGVDSVRFVPFPIVAPSSRPRRASGGPLQLIAVGRLAPAKGTDVLIEAAGSLHAEGLEFELQLVGNPAFSPPHFVGELGRRIDELGLRAVVSIAGDVDDAGLWDRLSAADILVAPSRHEGLCVPVVEAYLTGCRVVAADGGNLRYVVQPPDPVVAAGDASALAAAIAAVGAEVQSGPPRTRPGVDAVIEAYSKVSATAALAGAVAELVGDGSAPLAPWPAVIGRPRGPLQPPP